MAPVDTGKLRARVDFVRGAVRRLERVRTGGRDAFLGDEVLQAATIRWLQTAVEALVDMANHVIAREGLGIPRAASDAFEILIREGVLPAAQRDTFLAMVRFRNRVVHLYDEVRPEELWRVVERHLADFDGFIRAIVGRYFPEIKVQHPTAEPEKPHP